jgi:hypothetical protein
MLTISFEGKKQQLSPDDLAKLPGQTDDVAQRFPGRRGRAVALSQVLAAAGASGQGDLLLISSDGAFQVPLSRAEVGAALVLYELAGKPLPEDQGGPLRLLVHGPEKCRRHGEDPCANVKDLGEIRVGSSAL